jgi:hypothetical protein
MLIETISFTTSADEMLDSMTRIIADRSVGAVFFGNYARCGSPRDARVDFDLAAQAGKRARQSSDSHNGGS